MIRFSQMIIGKFQFKMNHPDSHLRFDSVNNILIDLNNGPCVSCINHIKCDAGLSYRPYKSLCGLEYLITKSSN